MSYENMNHSTVMGFNRLRLMKFCLQIHRMALKQRRKIKVFFREAGSVLSGLIVRVVLKSDLETMELDH